MKRTSLYRAALRLTLIPLLVLIWLQLITGLGSIKGRALESATLGLLDPARAGKMHGVWFPLGTGILLYLHATLGFQMVVRRARWVKRKALWEIAVFLVGAALLAQFLWLYFA